MKSLSALVSILAILFHTCAASDVIVGCGGYVKAGSELSRFIFFLSHQIKVIYTSGP
jgi:hypothetical protein